MLLCLREYTTVKIKPMLMRLEGALNSSGLAQEIILLPGANSISKNSEQIDEAINLVVAYNGSAKSNTALDLTLWIAHQTRLVTQKLVTVNVVHVIETNELSQNLHSDKFVNFKNSYKSKTSPQLLQQTLCTNNATSTLIKPTSQAILQQAQYLAAEWSDSLELHLQFGSLSQILLDLIEKKTAVLLFVGCDSVNHSLIQQLGENFPCPVLGVPQLLNQ
jgi:hypothetical protein